MDGGYIYKSLNYAYKHLRRGVKKQGVEQLKMSVLLSICKRYRETPCFSVVQQQQIVFDTYFWVRVMIEQLQYHRAMFSFL